MQKYANTNAFKQKIKLRALEIRVPSCNSRIILDDFYPYFLI